MPLWPAGRVGCKSGLMRWGVTWQPISMYTKCLCIQLCIHLCIHVSCFHLSWLSGGCCLRTYLYCRHSLPQGPRWRPICNRSLYADAPFPFIWRLPARHSALFYACSSSFSYSVRPSDRRCEPRKNNTTTDVRSSKAHSAPFHLHPLYSYYFSLIHFIPSHLYHATQTQLETYYPNAPFYPFTIQEITFTT